MSEQEVYLYSVKLGEYKTEINPLYLGFKIDKKLKDSKLKDSKFITFYLYSKQDLEIQNYVFRSYKFQTDPELEKGVYLGIKLKLDPYDIERLKGIFFKLDEAWELLEKDKNLNEKGELLKKAMDNYGKINCTVESCSYEGVGSALCYRYTSPYQQLSRLKSMIETELNQNEKILKKKKEFNKKEFNKNKNEMNFKIEELNNSIEEKKINLIKASREFIEILLNYFNLKVILEGNKKEKFDNVLEGNKKEKFDNDLNEINLNLGGETEKGGFYVESYKDYTRDVDYTFLYENGKLIKLKILKAGWIGKYLKEPLEYHNQTLTKETLENYFSSKYNIKINKENIKIINSKDDSIKLISKKIIENFEIIYFGNIVSVGENEDKEIKENSTDSYTLYILNYLNIFRNCKDLMKVKFSDESKEKEFNSRFDANMDSFSINRIEKPFVYLKKSPVKNHFNKPYIPLMHFKVYKKGGTIICENIK